MTTDRIRLEHGSGGKASHDLIAELVLPAFENDILSALNDGGTIVVDDIRLAFSTDSYVVDPIFFPGGDIGKLSVNGTVNDLAMCGATPLYLSAGLVIEEGFPLADLKRVINSMRCAAEKAGVTIITGDTKVVPGGAADKLFINTSGIGRIPPGVSISGGNARPGDKILLSGTMADHGMTILTQREGIRFDTSIRSDSAALNHMVAEMLSVCKDIHVLRDPTRGGVGTALNEIAGQSNVDLEIWEETLPIKKEIAGLCELLGFDPMYVANEGKLLAFVDPEKAKDVLSVMTGHPLGQDACIIGEVVEKGTSRVVMKTRIGGTRIVDMLAVEQLPRIC